MKHLMLMLSLIFLVVSSCSSPIKSISIPSSRYKVGGLWKIDNVDLPNPQWDFDYSACNCYSDNIAANITIDHKTKYNLSVGIFAQSTVDSLRARGATKFSVSARNVREYGITANEFEDYIFPAIIYNGVFRANSHLKVPIRIYASTDLDAEFYDSNDTKVNIFGVFFGTDFTTSTTNRLNVTYKGSTPIAFKYQTEEFQYKEGKYFLGKHEIKKMGWYFDQSKQVFACPPGSIFELEVNSDYFATRFLGLNRIDTGILHSSSIADPDNQTFVKGDDDYIGPGCCKPPNTILQYTMPADANKFKLFRFTIGNAVLHQSLDYTKSDKPKQFDASNTPFILNVDCKTKTLTGGGSGITIYRFVIK